MLSPFKNSAPSSDLSETNPTEAMLHIRFNGQSFDLPLADLEVGELSGDVEIKHALSRYLGVGVDRFRDYRVDRHPNGNLTVRPHAVFG